MSATSGPLNDHLGEEFDYHDDGGADVGPKGEMKTEDPVSQPKPVDKAEEQKTEEIAKP